MLLLMRNVVLFGSFGRASFVIPSRERARLKAQFAGALHSRESSHEFGQIEHIEHTEPVVEGPGEAVQGPHMWLLCRQIARVAHDLS